MALLVEMLAAIAVYVHAYTELFVLFLFFVLCGSFFSCLLFCPSPSPFTFALALAFAFALIVLLLSWDALVVRAFGQASDVGCG